MDHGQREDYMGAICRSRWRLVGADPVRNIVLAYLDSHRDRLVKEGNDSKYS